MCDLRRPTAAVCYVLRAVIYVALAAAFALADDAGELLAAAGKGDVARIQTLLQHGADIECADRNGRTPLMLAAQRGHTAAVKALLAAGAKPDARDRAGLNAYAIALLSPAGHDDRDGTLAALPRPPRYRISAIAGWSPGALVSSCFEPRERIVQRVGLLKPEEMLLRELAAFVRTSGRGAAELASVDAKNIEPLHSDAAEGADAILLMEIQPGSACTGTSGDTLTFGIDVQIFRARDRELLLHKSFGGGFKGMRALTISNASQYTPVYESWVKQQPGPIYWAAVEALMKSTR
jgi:hypothetical protein